VDEVVKLMLEGPPSQNMKETHGLLEDGTSMCCTGEERLCCIGE